jgi:F420-dependent oxidoreductase-like protein
MRFSAWPQTSVPWNDLLDEVQHVEKTGWDGVWIADHFMPPWEDNSGPVQELWTVLAAFAALVPRVRLGSLVVGNTYRNPAVLAKQVAQVDIISGGRVILGMGSGWQLNEHEAYDIPFYTVGQRLRRLEESVQILRSLFDNEHTTFEGRYYHIKDAPLSPKPVQQHMPILVGGGGEKVTLRIVARYADEWNTWGRPSTLQRKGEVLERHLEDAKRNPSEIKRSAQVLTVVSNDQKVIDSAQTIAGLPMLAGSVEQMRDSVGQYIEAKVDEFIVPDWNLGETVEQREEAYDRFIEDVASKFR